VLARWEEGDEEKELEVLNGTWLATCVTIDGKVVNADDLQEWELTLIAETHRFRLREPNTIRDGVFKISALGRKRIDFATGLPMFSAQGIYFLNGGTLTICFAETERPTEFTAPKGSRRTLLVLKRGE
jgi:uncharacterized protein (TIGR03067 family)